MWIEIKIIILWHRASVKRLFALFANTFNKFFVTLLG